MSDRAKFVSLLLSRFFGGIALQFFIVAGIDKLFEETLSPIVVGGIGFALFLPSFLGPFGVASLTSRSNHPSRLLVIVQLGVFLVSLLALRPPLSPWMIFFIALLLSFFRVLRAPLFYSTIAVLRDRGLQPQQAARGLSLSWQLPLILGPLLYSAVTSVESPFTVSSTFVLMNFVSFAFVIPFYFSAKEKQKIAPRPSSRITNVSEFIQVFKQNSYVALPILADALVGSLLAFTTLIPFLLNDLNRDSSDLGVIRAAMNFGMVGVTVLCPKRLFDTDANRLYYVSLILLSLVVFLISQTQSLIVLVIMVSIFGVIDGWGVLYRDALLMRHARTDEIAALSSIQQFLISVTDDLGEWRAGGLAQVTGSRAALAVSAIAAGTVAIVFSKKFVTESFIQNSYQQNLLEEKS